jgi:hypothetical protein
VAVHLDRKAKDPLFFKSAFDRKRWSHVAKIKDAQDLKALNPYLKEAYEFSVEGN